ncbi:hypothetical protein [Mycetocola sp. JXN-3]|uniref:hypothetical protein n=1 Tax=Mycetocola sp. JXN-3 TaxID=2116510 RepID=UPI00165CF470|nr:hypothetical protein [Mycetocola sp. JXN-3]
MSILVLGGSGAVGARIVALLREDGFEADSAGRNPDRNAVVLPLTAGGPLDDFRVRARAYSIIVNASGIEDPRLARAAPHATFLDISATAGYLRTLARFPTPGGLLLGIGLAPGLTGILADAVYRQDPGPLDIAILLGAGEHHGPAARAWTFAALGQRYPDPESGRAVLSYTRPRRFHDPGDEHTPARTRTLTRVRFADEETLTARWETPVRTYLATESVWANGALRVATRIPRILRPLLERVEHLPGSERWWVAAVSASGHQIGASGWRQSEATARITVAAIRRAEAAAGRALFAPDVLGLADLNQVPGLTLIRS